MHHHATPPPRHPPRAVRDGEAFAWAAERFTAPLADPPRTVLLFINKGTSIVTVHEALPVPDIDQPADECWVGNVIRIDHTGEPLLRPSYAARHWLGKDWNDRTGRALRGHIAARAVALWRSYRALPPCKETVCALTTGNGSRCCFAKRR